MEPTTLATFAATWGLLVLLPGPDTALALSRSLVRGRGAGLEAVAGSMTALTVHLTAAGLGLSALLASSATAFTVLKLAGAAYLVVLGLRLILADHDEDGAATELVAPGFGLRNGFAQAVLTGLLNPKSALFFLTFLPQFLDRSSAIAPQLLLLGAVTLVIAAAWATGIVLVADRIRATLARPRLRARIERLTGTIFVVFGTRLVSASR